MKIKLIFFFILLVLFSSFVYADFGYNNPSLPTLQPDEPIGGTTLIEGANYSINVNRTDYWDDLDTFNTTQMSNNGGVLNILESWLTDFINTFGFLTSESDPLWTGNQSSYYTKDEVNSTIDTKILEFNSTLTTGGSDNLGNHNATQNLSINSHYIWLSGNETIEGSTFIYAENGITYHGVVVI